MPYNDNDNDRNRSSHMSLDEIEAREQEEKKKEKKKFNIFAHAYDDGKGVDPNEERIIDNPNLVNFFKLVGRKINQLLTINIIMIVGNFPIFFFLLAMSGYLSIHTTSPYYTVFAPLRGAMLFHNSPAVSAVWTIYQRQAEVTVHTTADYVLLGLTLLLVLTFGVVRVGVTYIIRNMFRGKPIFMMTDFFGTIKRNLRQTIIYGIMDSVIIFMIGYDILFFNLNYGANFVMNTMFFMSLCLAVLYFFMRNYIYLMLVTFDLSIFKMFKNALSFTVLGIKRNAMALLGVLLLAGLEYVLLFAYFPLAVIVPFIILPSLIVLIGVYAAYPVIKKHMIDPYYEEIGEVSPDDAAYEEKEE